MMALLVLCAALEGALPGAVPALTVSPLLVQHGVLFRSSAVTAGGAGGGPGVQLSYGPHYVAQVDAGVLLGFGAAGIARLALGVQRARPYAPAAWGTFSVLFGQHLEFLTGDGSAPAPQQWTVGVRASPLRFAGSTGVVSLLEPGIAAGLRGGYALELTLVQASIRL